MVNKPITDDFIKKMASGVPILGTVTKKCKVAKDDSTRFRIILTQGLNRQIRRMCECVGYEVVNLKRVRIMNITLNKLPQGQWRLLTDDEIETINKSIENSEGGEIASKNAGAGKQRDRGKGYGSGNSSNGRKATGVGNRYSSDGDVSSKGGERRGGVSSSRDYRGSASSQNGGRDGYSSASSRPGTSSRASGSGRASTSSKPSAGNRSGVSGRSSTSSRTGSSSRPSLGSRAGSSSNRNSGRSGSPKRGSTSRGGRR